MKGKKLTPTETLAEAARDAVNRIAIAAKEAESRLASAARDAHQVVVTASGRPGENWEDYKKLVMSELDRLNVNIKDGFDKIGDQFKTHEVDDRIVFSGISTEFKEIKSDLKSLSEDVVMLNGRTSRQLWIVYGSALGSGIAILAHWLK